MADLHEGHQQKRKEEGKNILSNICNVCLPTHCALSLCNIIVLMIASTNVLPTPASLNLMCTPEAASSSFDSSGLMHFSMRAGSPLCLKLIRSL